MSIQRTIAELGLTQDLLKVGLESLSSDAVTVDSDRVALTATYMAEQAIAAEALRLARVQVRELPVPADLWGDFEPHEHQRSAIEALAGTPFMIITGGPGVGKTTIVRKALQLFKSSGAHVLQMAPTGKAAIRMAEQTGHPASTIHRALGWTGDGWYYHARRPIPASVIVIDESSMIDVELMADLLAAIRTGTRVLVVGDVDQLPSIRAGRVLHDLITSGQFTVCRLTKIFRQAAESRIPYVARDINQGQLPSNLDGEGTDVRFIERNTEEETLQLIMLAVTKGIPEQKGIPAQNIQVIAAQKSGLVGVENLNLALQNALNPTTDHESDVAVGGPNYMVRKGDRVIHTKNNYDLEVMNGEMGWVLGSNPNGLDLGEFPTVRTAEDKRDAPEPEPREENDDDETDADEPETDEPEEPTRRKQKYVLVVQFDGHDEPIGYTAKEAREVQLGYCITIHKSQGSQFPAVVIPTHSVHQWMLSRALVYTGLTRAEKYVLMVGHERALAKAARNTRGTERRTQLQRFLRDVPRS
jgi:exodeoxyribonuclease V alpha subunit